MKYIYIFIYAEKKRRTRPLSGVPETTLRVDDSLERLSQDSAHSDPQSYDSTARGHTAVSTGKRTCGKVQWKPGASFWLLSQ